MRVLIIDHSEADVRERTQTKDRLTRSGDTVDVCENAGELSLKYDLAAKTETVLTGPELRGQLETAELVVVHIGPKARNAANVRRIINHIRANTRPNCHLIAVSNGPDFVDAASLAGATAMDHSQFSQNCEIACDRATHSSATGAELLLDRIRGGECSRDVMAIMDGIFTPLLPLHLSLQAFFGISRDGKGGLVAIGDGSEAAWRDGTYLEKEGTPLTGNQNAFLLVPEAEWDFYAEIGGRLYGKPEEEPPPSQTGWSVPKLVQKFVRLAKQLPAVRDSDIQQLQKSFEEIVSSEAMRSLCGILASVEPKDVERSRGLTSETGKHAQWAILGMHALKDCLMSEKHTKWPVGDSVGDDTPFAIYSDVLVPQIVKWNQGEDRAGYIIASIEKIAVMLSSLTAAT